ncbi:MAG: sigma-70 family RNA polymerase sigma factor [Chloroflexota bacterium]
METTSLIQAAQGGDLEAFNRIVLQHQDLLFGIAVRMLNDEDDAADAVQEALIAAFRKLDTFRGGNLRSWLARITVNACYDQLRSRKRRKTVPLEPLDEDDEPFESAYWMADPALGPEAFFDLAETRDAIQESLDRLTPAYRATLILVDIEGLPYQDAALALKVPVGTVKSRLARARLQMQQALGSRETEPQIPLLFRLPEMQVS